MQAIVAGLEATGYLTRARTGRRVVYTVNRDRLFRHAAQELHGVGPLLDLLAFGGDPGCSRHIDTLTRGEATGQVTPSRHVLPRKSGSCPAATSQVMFFQSRQSLRYPEMRSTAVGRRH